MSRKNWRCHAKCTWPRGYTQRFTAIPPTLLSPHILHPHLHPKTSPSHPSHFRIPSLSYSHPFALAVNERENETPRRTKQKQHWHANNLGYKSPLRCFKISVSYYSLLLTVILGEKITYIGGGIGSEITKKFSRINFARKL